MRMLSRRLILLSGACYALPLTPSLPRSSTSRWSLTSFAPSLVGRLLISSRGEGKRVSISAIMLQISSGIALLWLANFAADFLMLHVLPERKHYRTYKQERTPDFSDLRNKIAEVEGEKKKLRERKNRFAAKLDDPT